MSQDGGVSGREWRRLWCIPQMSRECRSGNDFGSLRLDAIGSALGRGRTCSRLSGVDASVETWSSTIIAELTR
jgi:hypothetical protein